MKRLPSWKQENPGEQLKVLLGGIERIFQSSHSLLGIRESRMRTFALDAIEEAKALTAAIIQGDNEWD